jgi:hypothetical protein
MPRRNRVALLLILPIVILIWFIGWTLYWTGSREKAAKTRKIVDQKDLIFTVLMSEEKYAT